MYYDPEVNILYIELSKRAIVHAIELGNFIIHISEKNTPVLIEVLNASKYKAEFSKIKDLASVNEILTKKALEH